MGLVLTRKSGQSLMVGDAVKVTVGRISHGTVRLVVEAPLQTKIMRQEAIKETTDTRATTSPREDGATASRT